MFDLIEDYLIMIFFFCAVTASTFKENMPRSAVEVTDGRPNTDVLGMQYKVQNILM